MRRSPAKQETLLSHHLNEGQFAKILVANAGRKPYQTGTCDFYEWSVASGMQNDKSFGLNYDKYMFIALNAKYISNDTG